MTLEGVPVVYPVNDYGPVMKGLVIGGLGIFHVFVAQFAIGGGFLMWWFEWLRQTGREPKAGAVIDSVLRVFILLSFVVGALTGVGMWLTSIQVSPQTIGLMVDEFRWVWATEWIFFWLEVIAGYAFYRYAPVLPGRVRLALLGIYSIAGWGSLFWINGILSWQLTPGAWTSTHEVWDGFFNPTFWPSLLFRTVVCGVLGALGAAIVINALPSLDREDRARLIHRCSWFLLPMLAMPLLGAWFVAVIPDDSRSWIMGGSMAMTMFLGIAAAASALIGGYAVIGLWKQRLYINGATATLLAALAFGATAGGEFVREGVRKPYSIRETLFSNATTPAQVAMLRRDGITRHDPYPVQDAGAYPSEQLITGRLVYRNLCSACHTVRGTNGLVELMSGWSDEQKRMNVAMLQWTKGFMPPFAGTAEELEALVQYLDWETATRPAVWPDQHDPARIARIQSWLDEAGTLPAPAAQKERAGLPSELGSEPRVAPPVEVDAASPEHVLDAPFLTTMPATTGAFIVLIAATLVLHMVFMQYSLAGSLWVAWAALRGRATGAQPDRVVLVVREWLPFAVSGAITAGIAPLLFVQVVYQGSFYTANLLLFNGWMAILPALIVAMWMLYLSKAHGVARARAAKAAAALLAAGLIVFVGRAFVENHLLSMQPSEWVAMYERGAGGPSSASVWSRLIAWTAMSFTTLAGLIAWQLRAGACGMGAADAARASRRLAIMAIVGVVLGALTAWWHARGDEATARAWGSLAARPYAIAAMCGGALTVAAWGVIGARNAIGAWPVAAAITGSLLTLGGAAMVREVHRCAALAGTPAHARVVELGGGALVFAFAAIGGVAAIAWIMVQVRRGVEVAPIAH